MALEKIDMGRDFKDSVIYTQVDLRSNDRAICHRSVWVFLTIIYAAMAVITCFYPWLKAPKLGQNGPSPLGSKSEVPAAIALQGLGAILAAVATFALPFMFCCHQPTVAKICGWLLLFSGLLFGVAVLVFPTGWGTDKLLTLCGIDTGPYIAGNCQITWTYILAILVCIASFPISYLALTDYKKII